MFELGKTYRDEKIPTKTKWFYSVSGIGREATYVIVASFLLIFLQEAGVLSTNLKEYTAMMGVLTGLIIGYRIFDGLNDPFMGVIIEKCHFKSGKYKPWIFIGSLTNIVCILALFCAPAAFPSWCHGWAYVGWFAVFYLLWGMTFTINDIAFWSMLPSMSSEEKERAKVTSLVLIFSYIGSFLVAVAMPFLTKPRPQGLGNDAYWIMGIVIGVIFVISQGMVFFFCKEHKRDESKQVKKEQVKFSDMIKVIKENDQVRLMVLAIFCYFFSQTIMNSLMQNVFYINIGYDSGKDMMMLFNAVNNISMITAMFFLPYALKKFARMSVFKIAYGTMIIALLLFFFYGMPIGNDTYLSPMPYYMKDGIKMLNPPFAIIYSIITAIIFLSQGISYGIIIIMMSNCIEYNEYKTGSRKEAVIFALRPLTTKLATSVQQGVTTAALLSTGVMAIMNNVSKINGDKTLSEDAKAKLLDEAVKASQGQIWGLKVWCVIIPVVLASLCWFLLTKYYKIDEGYYKNICAEINKRNSK